MKVGGRWGLVTFRDARHSHSKPNHLCCFAPGEGKALVYSTLLLLLRTKRSPAQPTHTHLFFPLQAPKKYAAHSLQAGRSPESHSVCLERRDGCEWSSAHFCAVDTNTSSWHLSLMSAWRQGVSMKRASVRMCREGGEGGSLVEAKVSAPR